MSDMTNQALSRYILHNGHDVDKVKEMPIDCAWSFRALIENTLLGQDHKVSMRFQQNQSQGQSFATQP